MEIDQCKTENTTIGNDTGNYRYRPCEIEWIKYLVDELVWEEIPVFVKQLGTHLAKQYGLKDRHGGDMDEWPDSLNYLKKREFPAQPQILAL